jgi:Trypsin-like peptidase domain
MMRFTRRNAKRSAVAAFALAMLLNICLAGEVVKLQRGVPFGMLNRVFPIHYGNGSGTCFAIDVDDKQYVITARHVVNSIKDGEAIQIYINGAWVELKVKLILPQDSSVDIAALVVDRLVAPRMEVVAADVGSAVISQDVYFLGFPFGLASQVANQKNMHLPFIKKAILSAVDGRRESGAILYLDGYNNPGFSGGPVIFANYEKGDRLEIIGVISGYRNNPIEVQEEIVDVSASPSVDSQKKVVHYILENTGIIVANNLSEIVKAIRLKPIGLSLPDSPE